MSQAELGHPGVCAEDLARADCYGLIARLFAAPLEAPALAALAAARADREGADVADSELAQAFADLFDAARACDADQVRLEFDTLFLGVGRAEMLPYASYHLAGFLHERPLVEIRHWLAEAGLAHGGQGSLTEDHLACLADTMRLLILTDDPRLGALDTQRDLFSRFIGPWAERFGEALESAAAARFFRPAGRLVRAFVAVERQAFDFVS